MPVMFPAAAPAAPPVKPPETTGAGHEKVVPAGTTPFTPSTGNDVKPVPLQIAAVIGVIIAFGSTVTITVNCVPVQLPDFGVTV